MSIPFPTRRITDLPILNTGVDSYVGTSGGAVVRLSDEAAFVGPDTTVTLKNKSLEDASTYIIDDVDGTKRVKFQVSGVATATTQTWTFPNASDTFVGVSTAVTLLNKTLNAATLTGTSTFTGTVVISPAADAQIELGRVDGVASTPVIDLHSGATATNYDARISSTGGNGSNGGGTVNVQCAIFRWNGVQLADLTSTQTFSGKSFNGAIHFTGGVTDFDTAPFVKGPTAATAFMYLKMEPSDRGSGKPGFYISKPAIATQWDVEVDGGGGTADLNFKATNLLYNSATMAPQHIFETRAALTAAKIPSGATTVVVERYTASGPIANMVYSLNSTTQVSVDPTSMAVTTVAANGTTTTKYTRLLNATITPEMMGATGGGTADDTTAINNTLAQGRPIVGNNVVYGVTGTINLPAGANVSDITLKQLAPGASLSVITLKSVSVNNLTLRRVKVNRNGNGTNGGLLNASGTNGALNSAYGMWLEGGQFHLFEDLEVWGDDSGTGIHFTGMDATSKVIRPYVHDMKWSRTTATDDQVQGVLIQACSFMTFDKPVVSNLTGVLNGTPTPRFTRGIPIGTSPGIKVLDPYVELCDQGVDVTGQDNRDIRIVRPVAQSMWTWGIKLANAAKRCQVIGGLAKDCGSGFVMSGNTSLPLGKTTDRSMFIDCTAYNTGSLGQSVVARAGFRIASSDGVSEQGSGTRAKLVRCIAMDDQAVPTMDYGFMSDITEATLAPTLIDCESVGHVLLATNGLFLRPQSYGLVGVGQASGLQAGDIMQSGSNSNGGYIKYADGTMLCWIEIDETASAWTTAEGTMFRSSGGITWTYPVAFKTGTVPLVTANAGRVGTASACGVSRSTVDESTWVGYPYSAVSLASSTAKKVQLHASGRWN